MESSNPDFFFLFITKIVPVKVAEQGVKNVLVPDFWELRAEKEKG